MKNLESKKMSNNKIDNGFHKHGKMGDGPLYPCSMREAGVKNVDPT